MNASPQIRALRAALLGLSACLLGGTPMIGGMSIAQQASPPDPDAPDSFSELAKRLMPSVVNISTRQVMSTSGLGGFGEGGPLDEFNEFFGREDDGLKRVSSLGSGFIIDAEGFVITNNHVIDAADEIDVVLSDGTILPAELVGRDAETDLALLKVSSEEALRPVPLGDSDNAEVGDWVVAIGNPFGLGGTVTAGIISARDRDINAGNYDDFIQTDAAINKGNSGGPLFNLSGEVIGVNTAIYSPGGGGSVGVGFSVPSNLVDQIITQLRETGEVRRGWLGVRVQGVSQELAESYGMKRAFGAIITRITEDGPAETSGLEVGDLILEFDGVEIATTRDLSKVIASANIGEPVQAQINRNGEVQIIDVTLLLLEDEEAETEDEEDTSGLGPELSNILGLTLAQVTDEDRRRFRIPDSVKGVLVEEVETGSDATGKLERGDVIIEVNFKEVTDPADAIATAEAAAVSGKPVLIQFYRDGDVSFRSIRAEEEKS